MLRHCISLAIVALVWGGARETAAAQHEMSYEFRGTHVALSVDRLSGVDYTKFEGSGGDVSARFLLNASEPVPTAFARFGFDVFIKRFSLGLSGGFTDKDVGVINPRVGYLFGITPQLGLWLRGGAFYASAGAHYFGMSGEVLLEWFPFSRFALHLGPTIDVAFANDPHPNYFNFGILDFGMTGWL